MRTWWPVQSRFSKRNFTFVFCPGMRFCAPSRQCAKGIIGKYMMRNGVISKPSQAQVSSRPWNLEHRHSRSHPLLWINGPQPTTGRFHTFLCFAFGRECVRAERVGGGQWDDRIPNEAVLCLGRFLFRFWSGSCFECVGDNLRGINQSFHNNFSFHFLPRPDFESLLTQSLFNTRCNSPNRSTSHLIPFHFSARMYQSGICVSPVLSRYTTILGHWKSSLALTTLTLPPRSVLSRTLSTAARDFVEWKGLISFIRACV